MIKNTFKFLYAKVIPLSLAAAMLFECGPAALAQQYQPYTAVRDNTRVVTNVNLKLNKAYAQSSSVPAPLSYQEARSLFAAEDKKSKLSEADYQALYAQYLKNVSAQDAQVNGVYKKLSKEINLDGYLNYAFREGQKTGKVCEGKTCYDFQDYVHGFLRARLYDGAGLSEGTSSQYRWNAEIMLSAMPDIYTAYYNYGVHRADEKFLQKYLRFLVNKAEEYCDNDMYLADIAPGAAGADGRTKASRGKNIRQEQCQNIGKALVLLGIVGESGKDKIENSALIYNAVKDTYKDDYGAITLSSGVAGLIAVGTKGSYYYIDKLLTEDTVKAAQNFGTVKNGFFWFLDLLSIESWIEKGTDVNNRYRGRGGRYLNPVTATFQYVDEDAAQAMGISSFSLSVAKDHPGLGYNVPYRNVFEDLGIMISSTGTAEGNAIAAKIVNNYAAALKTNGNINRSVHTALVTGVLQTGTVKGTDATFAAQKMNTLDWWDLNEATQRRINNAASKYHGTLARTIDQAKIKRNENNQKIIQAGVWTDMLISAVFVMYLVVSLPSIVKNAATLTRNISRIRAIKAAGKTNLLKITRARIAALPVKPAEVKAILKAKKPATVVKETPKPLNTLNKEIPVKPSAPYKGQIQHGLTETGTPSSFITTNNTVLTATVGEGGGGSAATAVQKVKKVLTEPSFTVKPVTPAITGEVKIKPFKPRVSVKEQRARIYKNRSFVQKGLFGDKFYNELSPFKQKLLVSQVKLSIYTDIAGSLVKYGITEPKAYVGMLIPAVTTAQSASIAPVAISRTVAAMPSALKAVALSGPSEGVKVLKEAAAVSSRAAKVPAGVPTSPFFAPGTLIAIRPQDRILAALPRAAYKSKGTSSAGFRQTVNNLLFGNPNAPVSQNGRVLSKKRAFQTIKDEFKTTSNDVAFKALADRLLEQQPYLKEADYIYRGLFVSDAADLKEIMQTGMDIDRVAAKPIAASGRDICTVHSERSNMCFGETPLVSMSYATGINMFNRSRRGYMTMVVAARPADLNTDGIWFLGRSMRADEIKGVFVYDVLQRRWVPAAEIAK